ncbi:MAG: NAD(P)H-dependent oxidoreductase subunit E, partial [Lentisphaeria bacterium]|nr:NAD(P)H-dependent oxidoreductase subunit E [Lentisphaeria bacterium]
MGKKFDVLTKIENSPNNLIKGLQAIQASEGYVSDEAIEAVGEYFNISPVEVEGVLTFYSQFKRVKPGKY